MEKDPIQNVQNLPNLLSPMVNFNKGEVDEERVKKVCREFESLFWQEIFKLMRKMTWGKGWGNNSGSVNEIYHMLLEQEMSRALTQKKGIGIGIGDLIYKQITRPQKNEK